MPVKSFKFVSPGVFINEIDNSFRPRRPDTIGPVVIGRSVRGLAMQPVKLESFSDFLTMYGDTVPGNAGGDVYRDGNYQSPMYGTYAAKAFLNASVAPVTYIRTLGSQNSNATAAGRAGWQTTENPDSQTFATLTISSTGVSAGGESLIITSEGTDFTIEFETAGTDSGSFDSNNLALINTTDNTTALEQSGRISTILGASTGFANYDVISGSSNILVRSKVGLNHASFTVVTGAASDASNVTGISVTGAGTLTDNGGAYGLWVFPSSSNDTADTGGSNTDDLGSAMLGAVWYMDEDSQIRLSGSLANSTVKAEGIGMVIESDASGLFTATVKGSKASSDTDEKFAFNFDDSDQRFVRKVFNTNPQLVNGGDFYDATLERNYWLGETFEQELREGQTGVSSITGSGTGNSILSQKMFGVILPIKKGTESPATMRLGTQEAQTGWVIGQDIGDAGSWVPEQAYKLFRLKGRGHGEWLHKNVKVSIENIRYSNTQTNEFGTFSLVLRSLTDTDANPVVLERFDNLTLDPRSTNYISRRIGDQYYSWVESERRLRLYGEYPNQSKFVYVSDINEGNIQNANSLVPFGYFGPPNFASVTSWSGSASDSAVTDSYIYTTGDFGAGVDGLLSGSTGNYTGSLLWPAVRLRHSASDGGLSDQTDAYFGMQTSRTVGGTRGDVSTKDYHRLWVASGWGGSSAGLVAQEYIFTMDDIVANVTGAYYASGSRADGTSKTATSDYKGLIDLGYNKFTMPLWGGFDGFDITKPDPLWNGGMAGGTELTNYAYNTYRRAIDTVADPEFIDMNLLAVPGLTNTGLTTHMVDVCEARADALALIDLPDVYLPTSEGQYTTKSDLASRQVADPTTAANALRDRQVDSSYGATFYPWVQTVDEGTGQALWVPPSVAMMGVLASSERSSQIWFAPAGFNRGGLSDGAAGIPVTSVSRRLTSKERDVLYEARINPIASFPSSGIVVFGQKTLQERPSALDRINVRRLVIYLKKQISILSTQILFEQNVQATWNRFKGLIEPFLANVKTQFGITDYRLILDESTTTPDLVDQNVVYAKIMIKPARAIEYIAIDFIVASTGASFDD
jgi:hypothetical protein